MSKNGKDAPIVKAIADAVADRTGTVIATANLTNNDCYEMLTRVSKCT